MTTNADLAPCIKTKYDNLLKIMPIEGDLHSSWSLANHTSQKSSPPPPNYLLLDRCLHHYLLGLPFSVLRLPVSPKEQGDHTDRVPQISEPSTQYLRKSIVGNW